MTCSRTRLAVVCLAGAAFLIGEIVTLRPPAVRCSVRRAADLRSAGAALGHAAGGRAANGSSSPIGDVLARWALRLNPRTTMDAVSAKLLAAGLATKAHADGLPRAEGLVGVDRRLRRLDARSSSRGLGGVRALDASIGSASLGFLAPDYALTLEAARAQGEGPRRAARTRSTCSRSASRRASASTARSRS